MAIAEIHEVIMDNINDQSSKENYVCLSHGKRGCTDNECLRRARFQQLEEKKDKNIG
jgi:hypothetical protein